MVEIVGHSQTKGRDNREPKLRPKPARQSSTLPMSEVWKRRSWLGCSGTARRKGRQTDMFDLKPPRHISTLPNTACVVRRLSDGTGRSGQATAGSTTIWWT